MTGFNSKQQMAADKLQEPKREALKRIAKKLLRAGASIPAPQVTGTIEGSFVTGLCVALALVEDEIDLAQPAQEPVAWKETDEVECPVCKDKGFPWPKCGHITYLERTQPQRTWVGLTDDELLHIGVATGLERAAAQMIADKLKEKNT